MFKLLKNVARFLSPLLLACSLAGGAGAQDRSLDYPRIATYGPGTATTGEPLIVNGVYDSTLCRALSRFSLFCLGADPMYSQYPALPTTLKAMNPQNKVICYDLCGFMYLGPDWVPNSPTFFVRKKWDAINENASLNYIWGTDNQLWFDNWNVNLGNAALVDDLLVLWKQIVQSGKFDGILLDCFNVNIAWTNGGSGRTIDFARAGYADGAAMDAAFKTQCERIVNELRAVAPAGFLIIANGTPQLMTLDGWLREGVMNGLWAEAQAVAFTDTVSAPRTWSKREMFASPFTTQSARLASIHLGINSLGSAYTFLGPDTQYQYQPYLGTWFYDEYSVNRSTGMADTSAAGVGWLGQPTGRYVQLPNGLYYRDFTYGRIYVNNTSGVLTHDSQVYYQRIKGRIDPSRNNGKRYRYHVVQPNTALFLLRRPRGY